jgi:ubiquinone/menaquinone biosynthesis C-methylase UbiE
MVTKIIRTAAEVYDEFFVPALFQQWGDIVANEASIGPGQQVIDVACGTGVLACAAARRVGSRGAVVGLDPNQEMLAVARRKNSSIDWREGQAESLPFLDKSFDVVVSQFGFMFFENQSEALREMMRVLRPQGRLAVAVCDAIDHSPGYAVLAELLQRLFGQEVSQAFRAPFASGDPEQLLSVCENAGIANAKVRRHDGTVSFDSIKSLVATERACVWTLGGLLNDEQFELLLRKAEESLQPFVTTGGRVTFTMPTLILTAQKGVGAQKL